ncbi:hypothetical protein F4860DRAFT_461669 [Xylaria cubensis]|nr:hypothetical protein F4860DRAFT_461669 [Xylaria cubensis]
MLLHIDGAPIFNDFQRFSCSELNIQRIELVTSSMVSSPICTKLWVDMLCTQHGPRIEHFC